MELNELPICDLFRMNCFKDIIENEASDAEILSNGKCPKTCSSTYYALTISDQQDTKRLPKGVPEIYLYTGAMNKSDIASGAFGAKVNPFLLTIAEGVPLKEVRNNRLADIAIIKINFGDPLATVITKDAKVTFADMLGNIGGTFGIFLGLSFVGLLDFVLDVVEKAKQLKH